MLKWYSGYVGINTLYYLIKLKRERNGMAATAVEDDPKQANHRD